MADVYPTFLGGLNGKIFTKVFYRFSSQPNGSVAIIYPVEEKRGSGL
jgi:hypothetical protein